MQILGGRFQKHGMKSIKLHNLQSLRHSYCFAPPALKVCLLYVCAKVTAATTLQKDQDDCSLALLYGNTCALTIKDMEC